jgi:hypothetical protein
MVSTPVEHTVAGGSWASLLGTAPNWSGKCRPTSILFEDVFPGRPREQHHVPKEMRNKAREANHLYSSQKMQTSTTARSRNVATLDFHSRPDAIHCEAYTDKNAHTELRHSETRIHIYVTYGTHNHKRQNENTFLRLCHISNIWRVRLKSDATPKIGIAHGVLHSTNLSIALSGMTPTCKGSEDTASDYETVEKG